MAVFSFHFILYWIYFLYLPLQYLVLMISNERAKKIGHRILLIHCTHSTPVMNRCALFLFSLSPAPHKAIHLLPLSLLGAERWVFDISAGYLAANELGGPHWLPVHQPSLSEDPDVVCSEWRKRYKGLKANAAFTYYIKATLVFFRPHLFLHYRPTV